jgi:predicted flap endonuclease-1-like 5' DNA nuclease
MFQPLLEVILWILLVFFAGCILGYLFRAAFTRSSAKVAKPSAPQARLAAVSEDEAPPVVEEKPEAARLAEASVPVVAATRAAPPIDSATVKPAPAKAPAPKVKISPSRETTVKSPPAKPGDGPARPKGIAAPRGGSPDELQKISGVGPKIELTLHRLGIFHFDQIAEWTPEQEQWVDDHLKFKGRIARDEWIKQAKTFALSKKQESPRRANRKDGRQEKNSRTTQR